MAAFALAVTRGAAWLSVLALSAGMGPVQALGAPEATAAGVFPVEDVRAGLRGHVETVLAGDELTTIEVELLGVLDDWIGPGIPIVLGRFVDETGTWNGVANGMSGSPVFVDGRLLGALSYRIGSFNKEPICGITPIESMLALERYPARPLSWLPEESAATGPDLRAIPMALSVRGLSRDALAALEGVTGELGEHFAGARLEPAAGSASGARDLGADDLQPGRAVSVLLLWGDMQIGATGTITWREGDRLLAFGHPFLGVGRVELPVAPAQVVWTVPSLLGSFKLAAFGLPVGVMTQDRLTAIEGVVGEVPEGLPMRLRLEREGAPLVEREFFLARTRDLTGTLAIIALRGALLDSLGVEGEEALSMEGRIALADGSVLEIDAFGAGEASGPGTADPSLPLAVALQRKLLELMRAPFDLPPITSIDLAVRAVPRSGSWAIERALSDRHAARPGETVEVRVHLVGPREQRRTETLGVELPADLLPGTYQVIVGSEAALEGELGSLAEARRRTARNPLDYLDAVREDPSEDRLTARLVLAAEGMVRHGRHYPALPGSAHQLLRAAPPKGQVYRSRWITLSESHQILDRGISGVVRLPVKVVVE